MKSLNPFSLYLLNLAKMCCYWLPNPGNMQPLLHFLLMFDFFDSRLRGKNDRCRSFKSGAKRLRDIIYLLLFFASFGTFWRREIREGDRGRVARGGFGAKTNGVLLYIPPQTSSAEKRFKYSFLIRGKHWNRGGAPGVHQRNGRGLTVSTATRGR